MPYVDAGAKVRGDRTRPASMMLRREYPSWSAAADRERARRLAAAVARSGRVPGSIRERAALRDRLPGLAARARSPTTRPATCARRRSASRAATSCESPASATRQVGECCGHDGTYAMKVEGFEAVAAAIGAQGLRRHAGRGRATTGSPTARWPRCSSSSTPARSRCTRCRCWPAPTGATPFPPARGGGPMRAGGTLGDCSTTRRYEDAGVLSARSVDGDQAAAPGARRRAPDLPVREHGRRSATRSRR